MVHGNHEGFAHLSELVPSGYPDRPVTIREIPAVDSAGRVRLLPSGWAVTLASGHTIGAVGGIEPGQRSADYHPMAYIDEGALLHLTARPGPLDLLITHQGPARLQGSVGSPTLDRALQRQLARVWCHGHAIRAPEIREVAGTKVVPLGDIPFSGPELDEPGSGGWALVELDEPGELVSVRRETPFFLGTFRRRRWIETPDGELVSPTLAWHLGRRGGG
jgi:hypothetical protein